MLLAGDVGGTKTLLGLFDPGARRPEPRAIHSYTTTSFPTFVDMLDAFSHDVGQPLRVDAAVIGVAGPVVHDRARLTNVEWHIAVDEVGSRLRSARVQLLNDLEAMAHAVEFLKPDEVEVLQAGEPDMGGAAAVIAAGTGLGQALLQRMNEGLRPAPTEGGHADFAARTDREMELVRMLRERHGRAEVEQVLSGPGLLNLHRFTHRGGECSVVGDLESPDAPAAVSRAGLGGRCQSCAEALRMFVSAYGAEAGNLALRGLALSGVYIGGGIAPKILPALRNGVFMDAFLAKAPMVELLSKVPVKVILNAEAGLIGAAIFAQRLATRPRPE
jgi:glucokinase